MFVPIGIERAFDAAAAGVATCAVVHGPGVISGEEEVLRSALVFKGAKELTSPVFQSAYYNLLVFLFLTINQSVKIFLSSEIRYLQSI